MGMFAIVENGVVSNVILADAWPAGIEVTEVSPRPAPGWTYDGQVFTAPEMVDAPSAPRHITKYAFWNRLTPTERVDIDLASIDDPAASLEVRQGAAMLRDLRAQVNAAQYIDLDLAETIGGVQALEAMGLLAEGRADQILDGEVLDSERAG